MELILQTIGVFTVSAVAGAVIGYSVVKTVMRVMDVRGEDYDS